MKILVLGASGMIGSAMFRILSTRSDWTVFGTARLPSVKQYFFDFLGSRLLTGVELGAPDNLIRLFSDFAPDVLINCAGVTKHVPKGVDPVAVIEMNALLPHSLAKICRLSGTRMIQISTDCVFAGTRGNYHEDSVPDATDLYGRSKILGEVSSDGALTLRTSTIGHEINSKFGLLEWFLSQTGKCKGYRRAMFSGLPTHEFARVVRDFVLPNPGLSGLYHVGGAPVDKFGLLSLIANQYGKRITIEPDDTVAVDRTLNSSRFNAATGYVAAAWPQLIENMCRESAKGR